MTITLALGLRVTSPVMRPTSPNSAARSRYFWLDSAWEGGGGVGGGWIMALDWRPADGRKGRQQDTEWQLALDRTHLDGRRVYDALLVAEGHRDGVLSHHRLARARVRRHQHRFTPLLPPATPRTEDCVRWGRFSEVVARRRARAPPAASTQLRLSGAASLCCCCALRRHAPRAHMR